MTRTCHGSCHCRAVRYEADIDLGQVTVKCNCSTCSKARNWLVLVKPEAFRLLAGADRLTDYQFGRKVIQSPVLPHLRHPPLRRGRCSGNRGKSYAVNLMALDDAEDAELAAAPVRYFNGRHDDWQAPLAHPGVASMPGPEQELFSPRQIFLGDVNLPGPQFGSRFRAQAIFDTAAAEDAADPLQVVLVDGIVEPNHLSTS